MAWSSCLAGTQTDSQSRVWKVYTELVSSSSFRIVSNFLMRLLVLRIKIAIILGRKAYPNDSECMRISFQGSPEPGHFVTSFLPQGLGHPCPRLRGLQHIAAWKLHMYATACHTMESVVV